jgi:hypothetical protein
MPSIQKWPSLSPPICVIGEICGYKFLPGFSPPNLSGESIETGNHVEKFFVDRTLAQPVEGPV